MALKARAKDDQPLILPTIVVSRLDVARLLRELEAIHDKLEQQKLHGKKGEEPTLGVMLTEVAEANKLDLLKAEDEDREHLAHFFVELKKSAPTIHMSFATAAPAPFIQKIINWLRREVHPLILLDIGLQPSIAAGCVIRTTNKYFDCSMGQHLRKNRAQLVQALDSAPPKTSTGAPA